MAVYLTDEGAILVDDKFDWNFGAIMAKVQSVTNSVEPAIIIHTDGC